MHKMPAIKTPHVFLLVLTACFLSTNIQALPKEVQVDSIVASINGQPISLQDVIERAGFKKSMTLSEASSDASFKSALDSIILEQLIQEEAKARKVDVSDDEVQQYINEIARRNNLSAEGFEKALLTEKRSLSSYKKQVRLDILRSKLTSSLLQGGAGVSSQEIEDYIDQHPEIGQAGVKVKLYQILISLSKHSFEEAQKLAEETLQNIKDGDDFEDVARESSEGPEASEAGLLGMLAEEDLSSDIFQAIFELEEEQPSEIVLSDQGFHIFMVKERIKDESKKAEIDQQVRKILERQKLDNKAQNYFLSELYRNHSVDRKI